MTAEQKKRPARRWGRIALAAAVLAAGVGVYVWRQRPADVPAPPTAAAELADITQTVQAAGVLQPKVKVDIGAQVSGQVRRLHVQLGQHVAKGELLVSLDPELARNDVQQAEATLAQQSAALERSQVDLRMARREAERQHRMLAGNATAQTDVDNADANLAKLEADLRGQGATLARLKADLGRRQLALGYTSIAAPLEGDVVSIAVQEGQTLIAAQITPLLLTLAQLDTMTVRARVAEADIQSVRVGQAASFTTLSGTARRYQGKVRVIQPIPEKVANAVFYNVLFDVDNHGHELLSDMTVQVELITDAAKQALSIPVVALGQRHPDGQHDVRVLGEGGKDTLRQIRVGIQDGAKVQVLAGLKAGERVLLAPAPDQPASGASAASATH
jgi:macrolide-specific efflux system membrane fusion protein